MKNQVLSIEQMQHLQELGVDTSKASCAYYAFYESEPNYYELRIRDSALEIDSQTIPFIPTFTLQDMLEMISGCFNHEYEFKFMYYFGTWYSKYMPMIDDDDYFISSNTNPLTCAYETLCWLAENGYLKGGKK